MIYSSRVFVIYSSRVFAIYSGRVFAIYQIKICLVGKHINVIMKPSNSPT